MELATEKSGDVRLVEELGGGGNFRDGETDTNTTSPSVGSTHSRTGHITLSTDEEINAEPANDGENLEEYGPKLPQSMMNESQSSKSFTSKASHDSLKRISSNFDDKPGTSSTKRRKYSRPYSLVSPLRKEKYRRLDPLEIESAIDEDIVKVEFFEDNFRIHYSDDSQMCFSYNLIEQELWRRPVYKYLTVDIECPIGLQRFNKNLWKRGRDAFFMKANQITLVGHYNQDALSKMAEIFKRNEEQQLLIAKQVNEKAGVSDQLKGQLRRVSLARLHFTNASEKYCLADFIKHLPESVTHLSLDLRSTDYRGLQGILRWICESKRVLNHLKICMDTETNERDFVQTLDRLRELVPNGSAVILIEKPHKRNKERFRDWSHDTRLYRHHTPHSKTEFASYKAYTLKEDNIQFLLRSDN